MVVDDGVLMASVPAAEGFLVGRCDDSRELDPMMLVDGHMMLWNGDIVVARSGG